MTYNLQVILGLVATVVTAWSVAVLAIAIKNNSLDQAISSQTDKAVAEDGFRLSQADQNTMVDTVSYTALVRLPHTTVTTCLMSATAPCITW